MNDRELGDRLVSSSGKVLLILTVAAVIICSGCASRNGADKNPDPFEVINRPIYKFNDVLDTYALRPVAKGYQAITPDPLEQGISNAFDTWTYPVTIVNDFLQGKFKQGFSDTGRFVVNLTIGVFGLFDPATKMGLEYHQEDFGQTFGKWGIPSGPYIVVPFFGPFTFRSGAGTLANIQVNPVVQWRNTSMRDKTLILWAIDTRARLIGPDELVKEAFDPYLFVRDAYIQNREFLVRDGKSTDEDSDFDEEFDDGFGEDF